MIVSTIIFSKKTKICLEKTEGKLRRNTDLIPVKDAINFNMRCAFLTIFINILIIILGLVHLFILRDIKYLLSLLFIGVFTFIIGLYNKKSEDIIKNLEVFEIEPGVAEKFSNYLDQWGKRQFSIKE